MSLKSVEGMDKTPMEKDAFIPDKPNNDNPESARPRRIGLNRRKWGIVICIILSLFLFMLASITFYVLFARSSPLVMSDASTWNVSDSGSSEMDGYYLLEKVDEQYDAYLSAMGTPFFVLNLAKAAKLALKVEILSNDTWLWSTFIDGETINDGVKIRMDEEFEMNWGRGKKGVFHRICGLEEPNLLKCFSQEYEKDWKDVINEYRFELDALVETIHFKDVITKRLYRKTDVNKVVNDDDDGDAPFSEESQDDESFWATDAEEDKEW